MQLKEIQRKFLNSVYGKSDDMAGLVKDNGVSVESRMKIYHQNVFMTLYNTLKNTYPIICNLTDERFFKYAANEYIKANKSKSGNLDDYGESFIDFLDFFAPTKDLKYLVDVAKYEWAKHIAYFAKDVPLLENITFFNYDKATYERINLSLHPSLGLVRSDFPLDKLIEAGSKTADEAEINFSLNDGSANLLIVRPEYRIDAHIISDAEYVFLDAASNGQNLALAYSLAANIDNKFDVVKTINQFIKLGVIVGV